MFEFAELTGAPAGHLVTACPNHRIVKAAEGREFVALEMTAGRAYTALLADHPQQPVDSRFPRRVAVYDATGAFVAGAVSGEHRQSLDILCTFAPTRSGTHYLEARGCSFSLDAPEPHDADGDPLRSTAKPILHVARADATDLGDITATHGTHVPIARFHGNVERIAFVRFALTEHRLVSFGLRNHRTGAELFLENAEGTALCGRTHADSADEWMSAALAPGTYYTRVRTTRSEGRPVILRYRLSAASEGIVPEFERPTGQRRDQTAPSARANGMHAPSGRVNGNEAGVSLGTVTNPDTAGKTVRHRLVGGNEAGLFELHARTGELFFTGTEANVERGTTEFVLIVRTDDGERSEDRPVAVSVTNADTLSADRRASGDGRISLGRVSAASSPGVALRYRLASGNESGLFEVDETTGELFFKGAVEDLEDAETGFQLTVHVDAERH